MDRSFVFRLDVIRCGWMGSKHQTTNLYLLARRVVVTVGDTGLCCCVPCSTCDRCRALLTPFDGWFYTSPLGLILFWITINHKVWRGKGAETDLSLGVRLPSSHGQTSVHWAAPAYTLTPITCCITCRQSAPAPASSSRCRGRWEGPAACTADSVCGAVTWWQPTQLESNTHNARKYTTSHKSDVITSWHQWGGNLATNQHW